VPIEIVPAAREWATVLKASGRIAAADLTDQVHPSSTE
jgi:hypothetical protein